MSTRFGLLPPEAAGLLVALVNRRSKWAWLFKGWGKNTVILMASMNREFEEYFEMAAKAKSKVASGARNLPDFVWKGFVDVKLTEEHKAAYAAWDIQDSDVWDGIASYCEAGVKIAITYNQKNASFTCSGTGQPASGSNNGYCVNAYAKSPYEAARVWLFKVSTILPDDWSSFAQEDTFDIG
jgi:hypothetical protein